jgi:anti-sigma B factor antagonist
MSSVDRPHLDVRPVDGVAVVHLVNAEIIFEESAVRILADGLVELVQKGNTRILISFEGVRYLCSSMLARLIDLDRKIRQAGGRLRLCALGPTVKDVFATSHLDRHFDIVGDESQALTGFGTP